MKIVQFSLKYLLRKVKLLLKSPLIYFLPAVCHTNQRIPTLSGLNGLLTVLMIHAMIQQLSIQQQSQVSLVLASGFISFFKKQKIHPERKFTVIEFGTGLE